MITAAVSTINEGTVDLIGQQGTTWELEVQVYEDEENTVPMDLSAFSARGQYRKNYKDRSTVLLNFVCSIVPYDATTNPDVNKVLVQATPASSTSCTRLSGVYDIEIYNGTDVVERILEGTLTITPEVTKEAP